MTPAFSSRLRWLAVAVVLALGVWAALTIRLQVQLLPLFPQDLPSVRGMTALENLFGESQALTVVLENPPPDAVARLRDALRALPGVSAVGTLGQTDPAALAAQVAWLVANLPPERFDEFQQFLTAAEVRDRLAATKQQLAGAVQGEELMLLQLDPLGLLPWLREAGALPADAAGPSPGAAREDARPPAVSVVALAVQPAQPLRTFYEHQQFVDAVRAVTTAIVPASVTVRLTGRAAFMAENSRQMERDMWIMLGAAVALVAFLFYAFYRSLRALCWVVALQLVACLVALIVGRIAFGTLNVISMGFAAILLGVGMDYFILAYHHFGVAAQGETDEGRVHQGVVILSEAKPPRAVRCPTANLTMETPPASELARFAADDSGVSSDSAFASLRMTSTAAHWRVLRRGIWLSSFTTAAAFGVLAFSSFPGLQQLAVLIAAGLVASAACATGLLPPVLRRRPPRIPAWLTPASDRFAGTIERYRRPILWSVAVLLVAFGIAWPFVRGYQLYNADLQALRPAHSEAYEGLAILRQARQSDRSLDVIVQASSLAELRAAVQRIGEALEVTPSPLLPQPDYLAVNHARWQPATAPRVAALMEAAGFSGNWTRTTLGLLGTLDAWQRGEPTFRETRLLLTTVAELPAGGYAAVVRVPDLGLDAGQDRRSHERQRVDSARPAHNTRVYGELTATQNPSQILPASWELMTADLAAAARRDFRWLSLAVLAAVLGLCWWTHRSARLVMLNVAVLALGLVGLVVLLWLTGQSLTMLSLLAVPLLVGLIIDISLHLVLGMEETGGDLRATYRHMAVPVCLTGLCTIVGFGAPALTGQPALRNFGLVMDLGILAAVAAGLVVLPSLYLARTQRVHYSATLYRAFWFELGAWVGKHFGARGTRWIGRIMARGYALAHPRTLAVVRRNLELVQPASVRNAQARQTLLNFGGALADYFLLGTRPRAEVMALATEKIGLEHILAAVQPGKGTILATAHLGLFELGALWLEEHGQKPIVLSLPEPSPALHRWRAEYRQRWGATTLEVGDGYFSSVEVVRLLRQGRCVAMLMDRPYDANFVTVDFPGGKVPFATGPVWLSLLSGSPIVAVIVARQPGGGYRLQAFPPVQPRWLPEGRDATVRHYTIELGQIFREVICQYPDQWYQFVPLAS